MQTLSSRVRLTKESEGEKMKCQICKKREANLTYSAEPLFALSHGWGKQEICRQCFIAKIEKHITECQKQLKEEKLILKKEEKHLGNVR
jgi:ribosomal protein L40E